MRRPTVNRFLVTHSIFSIVAASHVLERISGETAFCENLGLKVQSICRCFSDPVDTKGAERRTNKMYTLDIMEISTHGHT